MANHILRWVCNVDVTIIIFLVILMIYIVYKLTPSNKKQLNMNMEDVQEDMRLKKAYEAHYQMECYLRTIKDKEIVELGGILHKKSELILSYLKSNQKSIPLARQFIDYYQDRTVFLLEQCSVLEKASVNNPEINKVKEETKEILLNFIKAYDIQLSKMMGSHLMDMSAELTVARQIMEADGIEKLDTLNDYNTNKVHEQEATKSKQENNVLPNWVTPKTIGGAALTVLGIVGLYKIFNTQKSDKKDDA